MQPTTLNMCDLKRTNSSCPLNCSVLLKNTTASRKQSILSLPDSYAGRGGVSGTLKRDEVYNPVPNILSFEIIETSKRFGLCVYLTLNYQRVEVGVKTHEF